MMDQVDPLLGEIDSLRSRLSEALEALEAIRKGDVDALVVYAHDEEKVYTLQGAEHPYRIMIESINEGATTVSEDGVVLWSNGCFSEMLKTPLENLLGASIFSMIAPQDHPTFEAIFAQAHQGKSKVELDLLAQDGNHIPVLLSLSPIPFEGQTNVSIIATDLTEHKRNIEMAAAERLAKAIIEQAAESIVVCDLEGKITRASQMAYQLAGQNPLFQPFTSVFPLHWTESLQDGDTENPEKNFSLQAVLNGASYQGIEVSLEQHLLDKPKGALLSLQLSASPLRVNGDEIIGCVVSMTDVTERKQVEQAIRQYAQKLERSNRDLEDFAFIASHDLQEPLRKVQSFGKILCESDSFFLGEEGRDYVRRMQSAASRMEKMIQDLLAYSRISTKTEPFKQVDLNKICRNVLTDLETRVEQTEGQVEVSDLPTIEADPSQMRQLFQNLLSNALKFHKPDTPPHVKVFAHPPQSPAARSGNSALFPSEFIELVVEDDGIGFNMEHVERIFQPFQRLHGRSEYEGSGVGLSICRKIVERHNGKIDVQSAPDAGATFVISLPTKQI